MKTREIFLWVGGGLLAIPIMMFLFSSGCGLMTAANDFAVLAGFVLVVATLFGGAAFFIKLVHRIRKVSKHDDDNENGGKPSSDFQPLPPAPPRTTPERRVPSHLEKVSMLVLGVMLLSGMSACTKVEPGYVGIKVNQYGSQKGVEDFPLVTGRVWYNLLTEDVYKFPTFLQNVVWTKAEMEGSSNDESITFNSIEGAIVNADIALSYGFEGEKVPALFVEFRKSPEHITDVYMRSKVRDYFSRRASTEKVVDIFGEGKQALLDSVKADLQRELVPKGFKFDMVSFVGGLRVDEKVQASINAVIEATQRAIEAENKVRQSEAKAKQRIAAAEGEAQSILRVAKAQAEANRLVASSLSPQLVQWQGIQRWNGITPLVTGGGVPFISIPGVGQK